MLRPSARGILVVVLVVLCWVISDLTRIMPARSLAAAGLLALLVSAICILLALIRLRASRRLIDDAVPVGEHVRVQLDLTRGAAITALPLGRGAVREHLPEALGGEGDLALSGQMPHRLAVQRRGNHELGPYSLLVRDLFGLFHLRRTVADARRVTGLPPVAELEPIAARAAGISHEGSHPASGYGGVGEIGPIARPYATGDDIRRVHWRASARSGRLMTREEEPAAGQSAVIVLDTSRRGDGDAEVEDRLVSHAATALESLGRNGWEVRVVDAGGDEITRATRRRAALGPSPLGQEADAVAGRAALLALAEVDFDDEPTARTIGPDHAAGQTALAIALGVDDGDAFSGLVLDRFAGRASHRTAIALGAADAPGGDRGDAAEAPAGTADAAPGDDPRDDGPGAGPVRAALGSWSLVRGTTEHSLTDLLAAAGPGEQR